MTSICLPPAACELRDVTPAEPWATIRAAAPLISRKVGVIRHLAGVRYQAQDPAFFAVGVALSDFSRCMPNGQALRAGGAGETEAVALMSAIGEAAERHSACFFDRETMVFGSFAELGDDAVPPDRLRLYSRQQVAAFGPRGPVYFDDEARIRWVWGYSLTARRPRLVPASLVYLNYQPTADEARTGGNGSTGLAAGATKEEAVLSGLLEVAERDAFTLAWMQCRPGRLIEIDDEELWRQMCRRLSADRPSVDLRCFDLTNDLRIPVVLLVMRRQAEHGPVLCLGAASRLSPRQTVRKCIQEGGQNLPVIRNLLASERTWQPAPDFSNLTTFDYHFLAYLKRSELVAPAFAFFDACDQRIALSRMSDASTGRILGDIEAAVSRLQTAGFEVIVVDVTTPDVAAAGLSVVRVIVPGLVPLHFQHARPFLGVRRLSDTSSPLNPFPHPFP